MDNGRLWFNKNMQDEKSEKLYEVTIEDGYFRTNVWGNAGAEVFEVSTKDLLELRDNKGIKINKLLCDIRELKSQNIDIVAQTKGIGMLWDIRSFDKVAFLMSEVNKSRAAEMTRRALEVTHFTDKFRSFEDETAAIAWLKQK